ncbi:hypothetical protein [Alkalibacter mobilis]|uniref:hypothetical protein n=1 Tax=Alkalibacter mobilis TaxID=2787712 RepID=UPI00189C694C|nr:hypothetical protein [Alkalibacter mobilis]MBF7097437.1 hypothetical protein [Alkalibacter mobilis]
MNKKNYSIVVNGDIYINQLFYNSPPINQCGLSWQSNNIFNSFSIGGGAIMLGDLIKKATAKDVVVPYATENLEGVNNLVVSPVELKAYKARKNSNEEVYRVNKFYGFKAPKIDGENLIKLKDDIQKPNLVVLDDDNNGFNSSN